eukprot:IDg18184t1
MKKQSKNCCAHSALDGEPAYIAHRLQVWDAAVATRDAAKLSLEGTPEVPITITLPDGSTRAGVKTRLHQWISPCPSARRWAAKRSSRL